ncbi:MAG TPA: rhodanese-like domain-containing protein [Jiangellaceae bacterium]|nr:rhodanese-like domain-containing protein [Jiangellaceae bacterium]
MRTIERTELQQILAADRPVRLVMVLGPRRYARAHLPGSETFDDVGQALAHLRPDDEIVLYCSGAACPASVRAYRALDSRGYRNVRRFPGGLEEWHAAGLPLAGAA